MKGLHLRSKQTPSAQKLALMAVGFGKTIQHRTAWNRRQPELLDAFKYYLTPHTHKHPTPPPLKQVLEEKQEAGKSSAVSS